jgi:hypothetical protein
MAETVMSKMVASMFETKDAVPCQLVCAGGITASGILKKHATVEGGYVMQGLMEKAGSRDKDMVNILLSGEMILAVFLPDESRLIVPTGPSLTSIR